MGKQDISCIVNDCYYYGKGNKCQADHILVTTDNFTAQNSGSLNYESSKELTPQKAGASTDTACKTYKPRNSSDVPVGGA